MVEVRGGREWPLPARAMTSAVAPPTRGAVGASARTFFCLARTGASASATASGGQPPPRSAAAAALPAGQGHVRLSEARIKDMDCVLTSSDTADSRETRVRPKAVLLDFHLLHSDLQHPQRPNSVPDMLFQLSTE